MTQKDKIKYVRAPTHPFVHGAHGPNFPAWSVAAEASAWAEAAEAWSILLIMINILDKTDSDKSYTDVIMSS